MLTVSREAINQLKEFQARRGGKSPVRIGILSGTTTGPSLGVTVDDRTDRDSVFTFDGLEVIVDTALLDYSETIEVQYVQEEAGGCSSGGFKITAKKSL